MALESAINQHLQSLKATSMMPSWPGMAPMMPGMMGMPPMPMGMPMMPGMMPQLPGPSPVVLSVAIDHLPFRYALSDQDLRETFQRWGTLLSVQVSRDGGREVGVVQFADPVDAADAQRQLHGFACSLEGALGTLVVVQGGPDQLYALLPRTPQPAQPKAQGGCLALAALTGPQSFVAKSAPMAKGKGKGFFARPNWYCKIIIQAEALHPDFPTVAKVVGEGGAHLDHIRSQCNCNVQLRGRKSGYVEPETGQELQEPMFIWISCDDINDGRSAVETSQDLLKVVYEAHQAWCQQNSLMHPEFVQPLIQEMVWPGDAPGPQQQMMPQQMPVQQMTPQQMAPQQMAPQQMAPQQMPPQQMAPQLSKGGLF